MMRPKEIITPEQKVYILDTCEMKMAGPTGTFPSGVRCQNHLCKEFANDNFDRQIKENSQKRQTTNN